MFESLSDRASSHKAYWRRALFITSVIIAFGGWYLPKCLEDRARRQRRPPPPPPTQAELAAIERSWSQPQLDRRQLPGMSIDLPAHATDQLDYAWGKLDAGTRYHDFGAPHTLGVTFEWREGALTPELPLPGDTLDMLVTHVNRDGTLQRRGPFSVMVAGHSGYAIEVAIGATAGVAMYVECDGRVVSLLVRSPDPVPLFKRIMSTFTCEPGARPAMRE